MAISQTNPPNPTSQIPIFFRIFRPANIFLTTETKDCMAKYDSHIRISGSIGDITFTEDGIAKSKSSLNKAKWKRRKGMKGSRRAAREFGGGSKFSSAILGEIPENLRRLARRGLHAHVGQKLAANARLADTWRDRLAYDFESVMPVMFRLDVSRAAEISHHLRLRTKGHPLHPAQLHVQGLRDVADAIPAVRNHHKMLRLHFLFLACPALHGLPNEDTWMEDKAAKSHMAPSSGWMRPEWIPEEGLHIALKNPFPSDGTILFVAVEWRHAAMGKAANKAPDEKEMQAWGILKVAALFRPVSRLHDPVPIYFLPSKVRRYRPKPRPNRSRCTDGWSPALRLRLAAPMAMETFADDTYNDNIAILPPKMHKLPKPGAGMRKTIRGQ
jgi:hypothetical protein